MLIQGVRARNQKTLYRNVRPGTPTTQMGARKCHKILSPRYLSLYHSWKHWSLSSLCISHAHGIRFLPHTYGQRWLEGRSGSASMIAWEEAGQEPWMCYWYKNCNRDTNNKDGCQIMSQDFFSQIFEIVARLEALICYVSISLAKQAFDTCAHLEIDLKLYLSQTETRNPSTFVSGVKNPYSVTGTLLGINLYAYITPRLNQEAHWTVPNFCIQRRTGTYIQQLPAQIQVFCTWRMLLNAS